MLVIAWSRSRETCINKTNDACAYIEFFNLLDMVRLHSLSQPITQPVVEFLIRQSPWQVTAIENESTVHLLVGGATVPSGLGVNRSSPSRICAKLTVPTRPNYNQQS